MTFFLDMLASHDPGKQRKEEEEEEEEEEERIE